MGKVYTMDSLLILEEVETELKKHEWYEDPRYKGVLTMGFSKACQGLDIPLGRNLKLGEIRVDGPYRVLKNRIVVCWDVEFQVVGESRQGGEMSIVTWGFELKVRLPLKVMEEMGQVPSNWADLCWDCGSPMFSCGCPDDSAA